MQGVETQLKPGQNLSFSVWKMAGPPPCLLSRIVSNLFLVGFLWLTACNVSPVFMLEVENTTHLVVQLLGGSRSSCPSGTWVRQSAVPENASDGKITNAPRRGKPLQTSGCQPLLL